MDIRTDYSAIQFKNDGKLKLLIIAGTRPEIIRLGAVINNASQGGSGAAAARADREGSVAA